MYIFTFLFRFDHQENLIIYLNNMKVEDLHKGLVSGKMGNLVYYVMNGKQYIRRVAIPGKKRKSEINGIHPKHKGMMTRFAYIQSYYSFFKSSVSEMIWKMAGQAEHSRADNLFHRINNGCFTGEGKLVDFTTFRFSYGELQLPRNIVIEKEDDIFRVSWEDEREGRCASAEDRLYIGVIYEQLPGAPRWAQNVTGKRGDMKGTFRLDNTQQGVAHVYCFFGREDETAYSESFYFRFI